MNATNTDHYGIWGKFTQMIWKDTTKIGCALRVGMDNLNKNTECAYIVCNYSPSGNVLGQFNQNVLPPLPEPVNNTSAQNVTDKCRQDFQLAALNAHNSFRAKHNVSNIVISAALDSLSTKIVNQFANNSTKTKDKMMATSYTSIVFSPAILNYCDSKFNSLLFKL